MPNQSNKISPFKPWLQGAAGYKGGKSVNEVKSKKSKIYKLSSNENPIGTSPKALKAVQESAKNLHVYPDRTAIRMQEALKTFYGGALKTEQFICANSGSETLELLIRGFLGEGLECIISNPTFHPYHMFSKWQGAKVVDVRLKEPNFEIDVAGILAAVNDRTRLIFLTSPNNPTGSYIPKAAIDTLLEALPEHVFLVLDEVYYHFADCSDYTTALPYVQAGKNVIAINSFSKTYGLASLRVGYAYSTPAIAGYIRQLIKPFILNTLSMNAAIAALEDTAFVEEVVQLVQTERNRLYPFLDELPIKYWRSQSNFILMKAAIPPAKFEALLLNEGIMVRNAEGFGAPGCIRVTIGNREANDALIEALRAILS